MFASGSSKIIIAQSVIHAETVFQGFVTEHNLPLSINEEITLTTFVIYASYLTDEGKLETSFKWDFMFF
jgi:hypothetical protein